MRPVSQEDYESCFWQALASARCLRQVAPAAVLRTAAGCTDWLAFFGREDRSRKRFDANSLRRVGPPRWALRLGANVDGTSARCACPPNTYSNGVRGPAACLSLRLGTPLSGRPANQLLGSFQHARATAVMRFMVRAAAPPARCSARHVRACPRRISMPSAREQYRTVLAVSQAIVSQRDLHALFHELADRLHQGAAARLGMKSSTLQ